MSLPGHTIGPLAPPGIEVPHKQEVVDFVKVNSFINVLAVILPRILDFLHIASLSKHFSKMDFRAGFHNVGIHPTQTENPLC